MDGIDSQIVVRSLVCAGGVGAIFVGLVGKNFKNIESGKPTPEWLGRTLFIVVGLGLFFAGLFIRGGE